MALFKVFDLNLSNLNKEVQVDGYPPTSYMALIKVYELLDHTMRSTDGSTSSSYMALYKVFVLYLNHEVQVDGYPPTSYMTLIKVYELLNHTMRFKRMVLPPPLTWPYSRF